MDNEQLGHLLDEYYGYKGQSRPRGGTGAFTIEVAHGLVLGAGLLRSGRFELFAEAGYVDGETLQEIIEDDEADDIAASSPYLRWRAADAEWLIDLDQHCGRVTLSCLHAEAPRNLPGLMAAIELFCSVHRDWVGRLEPMPLAHQSGNSVLPAWTVCEGFNRA